MKKNLKVFVSSMLVGAMAFTSVSSALPVSALNIGAVEVEASETEPTVDLTGVASDTIQGKTGVLVSAAGDNVYVDATAADAKLRWNGTTNWQLNPGTKLYIPVESASKLGLTLYNYKDPVVIVGDLTNSETIDTKGAFTYTSKAYKGNTLANYGFGGEVAEADEDKNYICIESNADNTYVYTTIDTQASDDVAENLGYFLCDKGYNQGDLIFENEFGAVYAAQDITSNSLKDAEGNTSYYTADGVTFTSKMKTTGVNTNLQSLTPASDAIKVTNGNHRLAYKIVAKKDCKVTAVGKPGSKVFTLVVDTDSKDGVGSSITLGTSATAGSGTGTVLAAGTDNVTYSGDVDAGKVAYFGPQGSNDNIFGIKVEEASKPVNAAVTLTLDGVAITESLDATITGSGIENTAFTTDTSGAVTFSATPTYDYDITVVKGGVTYNGTLSVAKDGTYESALDLQPVAALVTVNVSNTDAEMLDGVTVNLSTAKGATPVKVSSATGEAGTVSGVALFRDLEFATYSVEVPGYVITNDATSFSPNKNVLTLDLVVAPADLPAQPSDATDSDGKIYVGYTPVSGYTNKIYYTVQEAIDAAADGTEIVIAPGFYHELITVNKSLTFTGNPTNATYNGYTKPVISYNQHQGVSGARGFHGDTFLITASNATISLDNIRIENTAEETLNATGNATALSSCVNNSTNTISLTNCEIYATRDTIYTGKSNCSDKWTFTNCDIYGFQDVVCGGGSTIDIVNCNWLLNYDSDARLLVPQCNANAQPTVMTAKNLTIKNADKFVKKDEAKFTKAAYLGRAWGNGSYKSATTQAIVEGYTDETGCVPDTVYFGFDTSEASGTPDKIAKANWLVQIGDGVYGTSNDAKVNVYDAESSTKDDDGDFVVVGKVDSSFFEDIDAVGFAVFDSEDNLKGVVSDSKVYTLEGSDDVYYSVSFVNTTGEFKVMPYYEKDGYGLVSHDSATVNSAS